MAEGPGRARVETERKSGRRRKKVVSDEIRKELIETPSSEASSAVTDEPSLPECAVCLQTCIYPSRLPCSHIFCFLCLKGIASQSKRCAMCRQDIPQDYLEHPDLLQVPPTIDKSNAKDKDSIDNIEGGYQWFYEGRNGWWQYDARTNRELELAYKQGNRNCELLIAGFLYIADFNSMLQMRRNEPSRCRRIKRDLSSIPKKGIAGIRSLGTDTDTTNLIEQMNNLTISPAETELMDNNNDHNTIAVSDSSSSSVNTSDNQLSDVGTSISSSFGDNCD